MFCQAGTLGLPMCLCLALCNSVQVKLVKQRGSA